MLSLDDTVRQVVFRLYPDEAEAARLLYRRQITPRQSEGSEYGSALKSTQSVIARALQQLEPRRDEGALEAMDHLYWESGHHGESQVDYIVSCVQTLLDDHEEHRMTPLRPRRTRTPIMNPRYGADDLYPAPWEREN